MSFDYRGSATSKDKPNYNKQQPSHKNIENEIQHPEILHL